MSDSEVPDGTVARAKATCCCCGAVLPPERVRAQLVGQHGGANVIFDEKGNRIGGACLLVVVTTKSNETGRKYRLPTKMDYEEVLSAQQKLAELTMKINIEGVSPIPSEPTPWRHGHRSVSSLRVYGMNMWGDLFTKRQHLSLLNFIEQTRLNSKKYDESVQNLLALTISKLAERLNVLCDWMVGVECSGHLFSHHDIPSGWDFAEAVSISESSGSYQSAHEVILSSLEKVGYNWNVGQIQLEDACESSLPDEASSIWFVDPPYWDNVAYADLSDFFFVWLKRMLPNHALLHDPYDKENPLTPKERELTVTTSAYENSSPKNGAFFLRGMSNAFAEGRRVLSRKGVGCVVFAHKTTEGWESLLSGMVSSGWTITASWPVATERVSRQNARGTASLTASVHLICRPRPEDAPIGDWGDVLGELPKRVGDWMERLQSEGIRGADLVFACIGPALEIYSRYSKVVDAEEREIPLGGDPEASEPHRRGFLAYVWEVVGRTALEQVLGTAEAKARNSTAGALEEDARLTALFLWTLQSTNGNGAKVAEEESEDDEEVDDEEESPKKKKQGYSLIFDVVRRFAQPLGIHLPEWEGRVIETEKGVVRLLSVKERGKQLFGEESISVAGFRIEEQARRDPQMKFDFALGADRAIAPDLPAGALAQAGIKARRPRKKKELTAESSPRAGVTTTLDRVHAAMLLQASGQTNALRALLKAEQDRSPDFIRLANALSALYPKTSEEKRLLDAMLLAMPRT
jgi:hypothetical protein